MSEDQRKAHWDYWKQVYPKVPAWGGSNMLKKLAVSGLLIMGISTFVFGQNAWTYLKTCGSQIRQTVKKQVPIEFEVRHAQQLVEDLVPEIRHAMHVIAEQQVEVEALQQAADRRLASLTQQKDAILALRKNLEEGDTRYVIAGKSYTQKQVEKDLEQRFRRYKLAEETLEHEAQILEARRSALRANEDQLATLISTKKELEAQLAQLDARMRAVQAAETASNVKHLDDSRLNRAKSLIAELNSQLDVKERLLDSNIHSVGLIPIERDLDPEVEISEQIDSYFQKELAAETL